MSIMSACTLGTCVYFDQLMNPHPLQLFWHQFWNKPDQSLTFAFGEGRCN